MTDRMHPARKGAATVIEEFLAADPQPSAHQWKELTLLYPHHAAQIAEVSLMTSVVDSDEEVLFDVELFGATRSAMLSAVAAKSSAVSEAKAALKQCRGPAARRFAIDIGLGERDELLNQIVTGEVTAPYVVIKRLAARLQVQLAALAEAFRVNFQYQPAHSFKSDGKPTASQQPISWAEAVRAAGITGEEAAGLLQLEKEIS